MNFRKLFNPREMRLPCLPASRNKKRGGPLRHLLEQQTVERTRLSSFDSPLSPSEFQIRQVLPCFLTETHKQSQFVRTAILPALLGDICSPMKLILQVKGQGWGSTPVLSLVPVTSQKLHLLTHCVGSSF